MGERERRGGRESRGRVCGGGREGGEERRLPAAKCAGEGEGERERGGEK